MRILVTGATGLIGNRLARRLAERGDAVRALVRDPERATKILPPEVEKVRGDVTDPASLAEACRAVELVFHAAGMPEQWAPDDGIFDRVNRLGTRHVLEAARKAGVQRVVYTSTMDVFAAPPGGTLQETNLDPNPKKTAYERSKQAAEREAEEIRKGGLPVVYVNPGAVYGPSPITGTINAFVKKVIRRELPLLPPNGMAVAYVDGVADVHLAAAGRAPDGERYLVADQYASMRQIAEEAAKVAGLSRVPPTAPLGLLRLLATVSAPLARMFGFAPLAAPGEVEFLSWDIRVDASKAQRDLGFVPTPLSEGIRRTVEDLRKRGEIG